ncbi:hypothetical protein CI15_20675 [Paraburkholderia monticola]|uniref:Pyrroline-5-carboxylate reductase catalytic N-terminal domain-containing protein n=1 Tax=Paraburkholderia monticola TaxID=1399968 RepID=A0A149PKK6_9BURK|nr:hypothetical protein [Paraburkholderia monticola]KXU85571.1 hypothetical protein CI15_20675 [Paraburkholderia monticola]
MSVSSDYSLSECARVTSAYESRFRVQEPNSSKRRIGVVALGHLSGRAIEEIADRSGPWVKLFVARERGLSAGKPTIQPELHLTHFDGAPITPEDLIRTVDAVILVASAHDVDSGVAQAIVDAGRPMRRSMMAVILSEQGHGDELRDNFTQLRPHMHMLVVTNESSYLDTLLTSFGV